MSELDTIRTRVRGIARDLDPDSRYVRELLEIVERSRDARDFEAQLGAGCRGQRHAGAEVFAKMSLDEKILTNLITSETALFRFAEGELEAIDRQLLPLIAGREAKILIVPCSHGEEAFTVAAHLLKLGRAFSISAFDVQPALIEEARTGRLTFGYPLEFLATPGFVSPEVLARIDFQVGDAFHLVGAPRGAFDLVLCRNFIGYFTPDRANHLARELLARLRAGGLLLLDSFCLAKLPSLGDVLASQSDRVPGRPVFVRRPE